MGTSWPSQESFRDSSVEKQAKRTGPLHFSQLLMSQQGQTPHTFTDKGFTSLLKGSVSQYLLTFYFLPFWPGFILGDSFGWAFPGLSGEIQA